MSYEKASKWPVTRLSLSIKATQKVLDWTNKKKGEPADEQKGQSRERRKCTRSGRKVITINSIILASRHLYLDQNHCVRILPILDVDDVKNWKVIGYDAIVLASAYTYFDVQKEVYVTHTQSNRGYGKGVPRFVIQDEWDSRASYLKALLFAVVINHSKKRLGYISPKSTQHHDNSWYKKGELTLVVSELWPIQSCHNSKVQGIARGQYDKCSLKSRSPIADQMNIQP